MINDECDVTGCESKAIKEVEDKDDTYFVCEKHSKGLTEIKGREHNYWKIRNKVVNELDTEDTMRLVLDLLGNLKDLEEEKDLTNLYDGFRFDLNEVMKDWN